MSLSSDSTKELLFRVAFLGAEVLMGGEGVEGCTSSLLALLGLFDVVGEGEGSETGAVMVSGWGE